MTLRHVFAAALTAAAIFSQPGTVYGGDKLLSPINKPGATPSHNWTGFYVGGYAGYGWGKSEATDIGDDAGIPWAQLGGKFSNHPSGFLGGAQTGFNFQTGNWVAGLEGDFGYLGVDGSSVWAVDTRTALNTTASYSATLRGRLGFAVDRSLFYVTGGAIWTNLSSNIAISSAPLVPSNWIGSHRGWTVGAGVEWAFDAGWSVKGEYLYYEMGSEAVKVAGCGLGGCGFDIGSAGNLVRVGLNYKFGGN